MATDLSTRLQCKGRFDSIAAHLLGLLSLFLSWLRVESMHSRAERTEKVLYALSLRITSGRSPCRKAMHRGAG